VRQKSSQRLFFPWVHTSLKAVMIPCIHDSVRQRKQYVVMLPSRTAMAGGVVLMLVTSFDALLVKSWEMAGIFVCIKP